jgi:spore germination protein KB
MKIEQSKISAGQFMFSIACFLRSSSLLSSVFLSITNHDSWISLFLAMIICIPIVFVYCFLAKQHPGCNLIQINDAVFGKIAGKFVSILYVWFFFTLTALNLRDLGDFVNKTIMARTPVTVIIILFILLCAWAIYYGLEVVTRYSVLYIIVSTLILLISIISTYELIDFENFLPILDHPIKSQIQVTHICSTIPFGEIVIFLMITPYIDKQPNKLLRYFIGGFLIGGILILLVLLRDIAVLGNTIGYFALPSFETLRLATLFKTISHMEILFAILLIILLFFKISFLFYASMLALSQILKIKSYRPIILPCAALVVVYAIITFEDAMQHIKVGQETVPFFWVFFEMLLPFITLIVSYIKKLACKNKNKQKEAVSA